MIDSDGHVVEPDTLWREYSEPEFREQLDVPGGGWVQVTGIMRGYPDLGTALPGSAPADDREYWADAAMGESWEEEARRKMGRPGGYDPNARLVDMDDEGIDVAVLYPTAMLTWVEEADVFGAACRAYNNWLRDYCSAAPTRLYGVGLVPLQDVDAAITEMRRCVRRPVVQGRDDPAGGVHRHRRSSTIPTTTRSGPPPRSSGARSACTRRRTATWLNACRMLGLADGVTNPSEGLALRQGLTNAIDLQMATAYFTLGGICERHPELRVAFLEGTGGWMVPMLERFDHQFKIFGSRDQTHASERAVRAPVHGELRSRRGHARVHGRAARRRQDPLGVRLPAPRRQDPGRREGARGSGASLPEDRGGRDGRDSSRSDP